MRISRISSPGALYSASAATQNFEDVGLSIENKIVFDDVAEANVTSQKENLDFAQIKGFSENLNNRPHDAGEFNLPKRISIRKLRTRISRREIYSIGGERVAN